MDGHRFFFFLFFLLVYSLGDSYLCTDGASFICFFFPGGRWRSPRYLGWARGVVGYFYVNVVTWHSKRRCLVDWTGWVYLGRMEILFGWLVDWCFLDPRLEERSRNGKMLYISIHLEGMMFLIQLFNLPASLTLRCECFRLQHPD